MIYSGGPLAADIPDIDLASFTLARAKELGGKPALIDGPSSRAVSYADLERSVRSLAAGLTARGFAKGDTFAIFMPNVPECAVAFHGAVAAGGRCTTANPRYTARELGRQLADSRVKLLLTAPPFLDVARQAAAQAGNCEVFALGEAAGVPSFSELLDDPGATPMGHRDQRGRLPPAQRAGRAARRDLPGHGDQGRASRRAGAGLCPPDVLRRPAGAGTGGRGRPGRPRPDLAGHPRPGRADRNLRAPGQGPRRRGHHPGHLHRGPGRRRAPRDEHRADAGGGPALLPAPSRRPSHRLTTVAASSTSRRARTSARPKQVTEKHHR